MSSYLRLELFHGNQEKSIKLFCCKAKLALKRLKGRETHRVATERHLPYGITQRNLPPATGERALP